MKFLKTLALTLALTAMAILPAKTFTVEEMRASYDSIVIPSVMFGDGCSGTIIKNELIPGDNIYSNIFKLTVLTAKHCVQKLGEDAKITSMLYFNNEGTTVLTLDGKVTKVSDKYDLAVAEFITHIGLPSATVLDAELIKELYFGMDVVNVGYPYARSQSISAGLLGHLELIEKEGLLYQRATPPNAPGSSGSALFAKIGDRYYVIGVLHSGFDEVHNYYVPIEDIIKFLETPAITPEEERQIDRIMDRGV